MKKLFFAVLFFLFICIVASSALADENPSGDVSFEVKWNVEPVIQFMVSIDGGDTALFNDGVLNYSNSGSKIFSDYEFDSRTPDLDHLTIDTEEIYGSNVYASVASNDWWKVEFIKPALISDNDHYTTAPVYAYRELHDLAEGKVTIKSWFTGNDTIQRDMGVYLMNWDLKIEYKNWHTRYGNYSNTFKLICTQL